VVFASGRGVTSKTRSGKAEGPGRRRQPLKEFQDRAAIQIRKQRGVRFKAVCGKNGSRGDGCGRVFPSVSSTLANEPATVWVLLRLPRSWQWHEMPAVRPTDSRPLEWSMQRGGLARRAPASQAYHYGNEGRSVSQRRPSQEKATRTERRTPPWGQRSILVKT